MRYRHFLFRGVFALLVMTALVSTSHAQTGRVGGTVKDDAGQPIKGATVTAENPNASPSSFTATTDDKGRFSIIGLKSGVWSFTAQAPGFAPEGGKLPVQTIGTPNPPLTFTLKKGGGGPAASALGSMAAKDLQAELSSADALYNAQKWDDAVAAYRAILTKAPSLSVINLQIAAAYRNKKDYDAALAAYNDLLKADPGSDKAKIGIGMTNMEKGDIEAAEKTLQSAAQSTNATREVFYNLGEVEFAKGKTEEATAAYTRAAQMDPRWGKPVFALGKVALNKGDTKGAIEYFGKVIEVDPTSQEADQAKAVVGQLKK
ncbi:MAG TPA: tetratricopeptide repeat protein [Vicinamibacterales bacterium]|jgi:Tfp pilus assembly protein PilF|nr:tetratricopeptide repeat protein [Vicinamibacterales bacterium]